MIYIHYDNEGNTKAYHHSCKNIPEPYITMEDGAWNQIIKGGKIRKVIGGKLVLQDKPLPPVTVQDYDRVLQKYIYDVRYQRGYTTRQPTDYLNSSIPRWKQDALDFIAFRDNCLQFGQSIINNYQTTGIVPTLEQFEKQLKQTCVCVWTYK